MTNLRPDDNFSKLPYQAPTFLIKSGLIRAVFSSFFFFRKNYLLLSCATSVRPSVRLSVRLSVRPSVVCGNNFFSL